MECKQHGARLLPLPTTESFYLMLATNGGGTIAVTDVTMTMATHSHGGLQRVFKTSHSSLVCGKRTADGSRVFAR